MESGAASALDPFLWPCDPAPASSGGDVRWDALPTYYRLADRYISWREWIAKAKPLPAPASPPSQAHEEDEDLDDLFDPDAGQKRAKK